MSCSGGVLSLRFSAFCFQRGDAECRSRSWERGDLAVLISDFLQHAGLGQFKAYRQWLRLAECHSAIQQSATLRYKDSRSDAGAVVVLNRAFRGFSSTIGLQNQRNET